MTDTQLLEMAKAAMKQVYAPYSGFSVGAALLCEKAQNVLGYGDHGSTFGGNPVACAGALSVLFDV